MTEQIKRDARVVAEIIRQALDVMLYKLSDQPLNKHEILGVQRGTHRVLLRGNTNLEAFGWAIYTGPMGDWQCTLNHNRYVRGTPRIVALSAASKAMLAAIPEEQGLYRIHSAGLSYRTEEIREPIEPPRVDMARQWRD